MPAFAGMAEECGGTLARERVLEGWVSPKRSEGGRTPRRLRIADLTRPRVKSRAAFPNRNWERKQAHAMSLKRTSRSIAKSASKG